ARAAGPTRGTTIATTSSVGAPGAGASSNPQSATTWTPRGADAANRRTPNRDDADPTRRPAPAHETAARRKASRAPVPPRKSKSSGDAATGAPAVGAHTSRRRAAVLAVPPPAPDTAAPPPDGPSRPSTPPATPAMPTPMAPAESPPSTSMRAPAADAGTPSSRRSHDRNAGRGWRATADRSPPALTRATPSAAYQAVADEGSPSGAADATPVSKSRPSWRPSSTKFLRPAVDRLPVRVKSVLSAPVPEYWRLTASALSPHIRGGSARRRRPPVDDAPSPGRSTSVPTLLLRPLPPPPPPPAAATTSASCASRATRAMRLCTTLVRSRQSTQLTRKAPDWTAPPPAPAVDGRTYTPPAPMSARKPLRSLRRPRSYSFPPHSAWKSKATSRGATGASKPPAAPGGAAATSAKWRSSASASTASAPRLSTSDTVVMGPPYESVACRRWRVKAACAAASGASISGDGRAMPLFCRQNTGIEPRMSTKEV
ncbi:hypothetical protein BU14_2516s0001, partial [Porphyra umbilicalis]